MPRNRENKKPFDKSIGAADAQNADTMPPIFSFERMVDGCGHSINCCDQDNQAAALRRLFALSKMKWREIHNSPRHGMGTEKISRSSINVPLPKGIPEDVTFLALRYNGKRPMLGYRDGRTFHVLFLDHNFKVYDHG